MFDITPLVYRMFDMNMYAERATTPLPPVPADERTYVIFVETLPRIKDLFDPGYQPSIKKHLLGEADEEEEDVEGDMVYEWDWEDKDPDEEEES